MSISSIFGSPVLLAPSTSASSRIFKPTGGGSGFNVGLVIECSSRPKKKATAHHKKTRPRKSQPWDIKRKPTVYAPLPPLPPEWTLVSSASGEDEGDGGESTEAGLLFSPALEAPVTSG